MPVFNLYFILPDLVGALVEVGCLRNITEDGWEMDGFRLTFEIMANSIISFVSLLLNFFLFIMYFS